MSEKAHATMTEQELFALGLDPKRLFVGSLERAVSDQAMTWLLRAVFEAFGQVTSINLWADNGMALVDFASFLQAQSALVSLNGQPVPGVSNCISVKFSRRF